MKKLYFFTLLLGIFLFSTTTTSGQNLIVNGNFETGQTAPWTAGNGSTITIDSLTVHSGTYSCHGNVEQIVTLPAGKTYNLYAYGYNRTPSVNTWLGIRDIAGAALVQNFQIDSAGFQFVHINFTTQNTGDYRFWAWGQAGSDYLSDSWILLEQGTTTNTSFVVPENKIKVTNQVNQVTVNIEDLKDNATINIYNMTGQVIHTMTTNETKTIIDYNTFGATGNYFIHVRMGNYQSSQQVMIMNE